MPLSLFTRKFESIRALTHIAVVSFHPVVGLRFPCSAQPWMLRSCVSARSPLGLIDDRSEDQVRVVVLQSLPHQLLSGLFTSRRTQLLQRAPQSACWCDQHFVRLLCFQFPQESSSVLWFVKVPACLVRENLNFTVPSRPQTFSNSSSSNVDFPNFPQL